MCHVKLNSFYVSILATLVYILHLLGIFMVNEGALLKCLQIRNLTGSE